MKNIKDILKEIARLERRLQHYENHAPDERMLLCQSLDTWIRYFELCKERDQQYEQVLCQKKVQGDFKEDEGT